MVVVHSRSNRWCRGRDRCFASRLGVCKTRRTSSSIRVILFCVLWLHLRSIWVIKGSVSEVNCSLLQDVTIGPTAVLSIMLGQILLEQNPDVIAKYGAPSIASMLAFLCGINLLVISLFRLGFLVDFIAPSVIMGFSAGAGLTIIISQIPTLLGLGPVSKTAYLAVGDIFRKLPTVKWPDVLVGLGTIVFLVSVDYLKRRNHGSKFYGLLALLKNAIVVILGPIMAYFVETYATSKITIMGKLPSGYPPFSSNTMEWSLVSSLYPATLSLTVVCIIEQIAVGKALALKNNYILHADSELLALGAINFVSSFFFGFPVTGSISRSFVKSDSGVKTPIGGVIASSIILGSLFFLMPVFYYIPIPSLSALIIVACKNLFVSMEEWKHRFRVDFIDTFFALIALLVVFFSSVEIGIAVSAVLSILKLIYPIARPKIPVTLLPLARDLVCVSVRFDHDLVFPNADYVGECIVQKIKTLQNRRGSFTINPHISYHTLRITDDTQTSYISGDEGESNDDNIYKIRIFLDLHGVSRMDNQGLRLLVSLQEMLSKPVTFESIASATAPKKREVMFLLYGVSLDVKRYFMKKGKLFNIEILDATFQGVPEPPKKEDFPPRNQSLVFSGESHGEEELLFGPKEEKSADIEIQVMNDKERIIKPSVYYIFKNFEDAKQAVLDDKI